MKVKVLVVSLVVALFVGLGLAYADDMTVGVGDSLIIVAGPTINQANWFCATQEQNVTQLTFGVNEQSATSTGGNVGGLSGDALSFGLSSGGNSAGSGGANAGDSLAGNLGLVGNGALVIQTQEIEAENNNESNMYTKTAIGSFNRITRVKESKEKGKGK